MLTTGAATMVVVTPVNPRPRVQVRAKPTIEIKPTTTRDRNACCRALASPWTRVVDQVRSAVATTKGASANSGERTSRSSKAHSLRGPAPTRIASATATDATRMIESDPRTTALTSSGRPPLRARARNGSRPGETPITATMPATLTIVRARVKRPKSSRVRARAMKTAPRYRRPIATACEARTPPASPAVRPLATSPTCSAIVS
jgi:hypothetical protein